MYTLQMYNIKHIQTIFSKNDTSMTLLSVVVTFVLPIFVFSFCYCMQGSSDIYTVKNIEVLEREIIK